MEIDVCWINAPANGKHLLLLQEKIASLCLLSDFHDWQFCRVHGPTLTCVNQSVEWPLWTRKPFRPSIHNYGNSDSKLHADGCSDTGAMTFSTVAKWIPPQLTCLLCMLLLLTNVKKL